MWEALPPVVSSSATAADELPGVHVATHSSGMLSGATSVSAAGAPPAYSLTATTPLSRSSAAATNITGYNNSTSTTTNGGGVSRSPGTTAAPLMPAVVATAPNSNPFATPRETSLNPIGATAHRDLSARSNVAVASPSPQLYSAASTTTTSGLIGFTSNDGVDGRQGRMGGAAVSTDRRSGSYTRDQLVTPHGSSAALPTSQHPRTLSSTSTTYSNARYGGGGGGGGASTQHQQQQQQPPPTPASLSASATSVRYAAPAATSPPPPSLATAFSPTVHAQDGNDVLITRSISPRHPHAHLDASAATSTGGPNTSGLTAAATASTTSAAPWQSPGSISIGSARLNNDRTSLRCSPGMPESSSSRDSHTGRGGLGRATSSTSRTTSYYTTDYRAPYAVSGRGVPLSSPRAPSTTSTTAVPQPVAAAASSARSVSPAVRLELAPLQAEPAAAPPSAMAPAGALPRLPQAIATPTLLDHRPNLSSGGGGSGGGVSGTFTSSQVACGPSVTRPPAQLPVGQLPSTSVWAETSNNNNNNSSSSAAMASGTSLTFVSPSFQAPPSGAEDSLMASTLSAAGPPGLSAVGRLPGVPLSDANPLPLTAPPPPPPQQPQQQQPLPLPAPHSATSAVSSRASNTIAFFSGSPHASSGAVGAAAAATGAPAHMSLERPSSDVVRVVRTEEGPPVPITTATPAATTTANTRDRPSADVRHRYALPPGVPTTPSNRSGSPPSSVLTPYHAAAAGTAGPQPTFSVQTPHAAPDMPSATPYTPPPQSFAEGERHHQHHLTMALDRASPRPAQAAVALQHQQHYLPMFAAQLSPHGAHPGSGAADATAGGDGGAHVSPGVGGGSMDHNQSFYFGTTGNDNLRRSFFFPPSARLPLGEREDGSAAWPVGEEAAGHAVDLAAYLRTAAANADRQSISGLPDSAATPQRSTSTGQTEVTEGDRYCSPVLYRVSSFPAGSPSQQSLSRVQPPPVAPLVPVTTSGAETAGGGAAAAAATMAPPTIQRGPPLPLSVNNQPLPPTPHSVTASSPLPPPLQRGSLPEEPLTVTTATQLGRPRLVVPAGSSGTSSPYTRRTSLVGPGQQQYQPQQDRAASTRFTSANEGSLRTATVATNTNASFLSPTLANSMLRHRFEDSVISASEASFALPESSAHAVGRVAARPPGGLGAVLSPQSTATSTPKATGATSAVSAPPGLPPAYVLDWERSLIAFQNRAESYYTFKDLCTEKYLTLIEHDVDRFLVCYYSGGAVRPEEAVQEALASRASTPAATQHTILSSTGGGGGGHTSSAARNGGGGGGLQKMIQTNKTLQKLSEAGSKWLTNLKRTAMTPVPVWGEGRTPSSSLGTTTPARGGRSAASSSVNSAGAAEQLASTRPHLELPALDAPRGITATTGGVTGDEDGSTGGDEEWWMTAQDGCNNDSAEPTYRGGFGGSGSSEPPTVARGGSLTSQPRPIHTEKMSTDVAQLLDRPLSSSGRSVTTTTSTIADALSTSSSSVAAAALVVGTPKKAPALSRLSYNIAAEEEMRCLRQLGAYMANVIPESYMDARPSEQVLLHVRCNYPIILHALQHVLMLSGAEAPRQEETSSASRSTRQAAGLCSSAAAEAAKVLIASRIRQGLMLPSIQATWRDYLLPLEMKVKELVQIATENIDPILTELQEVPSEDSISFTGELSVAALAELQARQRLRAQRDQPVRRLARLLRGDEEYLTTIHAMDDEFIDSGEAWQTRSAAMRGAGAALSNYVPVYGLVLSRLHRLEIEHRTVLELWCGGVSCAGV